MKARKARVKTTPLIVKKDRTEPTIINTNTMKKRVGYKSGGCCGKRR
ncbi:hypothetical protein [Halobacillus sp. Marseille-P3879]|nr:hypothetical protein [Halobacillus sp. Marseille-P3879]